ncbi:MAG TPA: hypothetical protein DCZ94_08265 [Lentisphaeria bacterium]|nr:MAG: hypothetical protein A2X48_19745 [Lentisphaerae bacterium GWF2_49_21]HBC86931.1 hypothetical protein [Lentisphaeria bacterium]
MLEGIAYSILAGCFFAAGAALFAEVSRRGLPFMLFLSSGAVIGLAISLMAMVDWHAAGSEKRIGELALWIIPGALGNVAGHLAMSRAMAIGRGPVAWAIGQGGQALTFIATVMIWSEKPGTLSWCGLLIILMGVAFLARTKTSISAASPARGWVFWSLMAMICYGVNQTLMSVPSHWTGWHDAAHLRLPITLGVIALSGFACSGKTDWKILRGILPWAVPYGLVICGCFGLVYLSLDRLSAAGCAAIGWPLSCSTGILGYAVWEHIVQRRPVSRAEIIGIATVVIGIIALAMRN